jgi:hypothetical protein
MPKSHPKVVLVAAHSLFEWHSTVTSGGVSGLRPRRTRSVPRRGRYPQGARISPGVGFKMWGTLSCWGSNRISPGKGGPEGPGLRWFSRFCQFTRIGHIPGGGGHFCGRVARLATSQGLLDLPSPIFQPREGDETPHPSRAIRGETKGRWRRDRGSLEAR